MPTPRNLVNLEAVTKAWGTKTLLDAVTLGVNAGDRVGVVGRNGGGKTTLLEVLTGHERADTGRVTHARDLRIATLRQDAPPPPTATVREGVVGDTPEHAWAGDAGIRAVLDGLGVHGLGLDTPVGQLSGGQRRRVELASLLVAESDLLILDEPTNHLDVEGIDWLAGHLRDRPASTALVVVTHDRWFLDAVCTMTWEVGRGRVEQYEGGYAAYVLARAERERQAASADARRRNLLRKELAWLRRGPPARTSKPKFRIDAANALIEGEPPPRDEVALRTFAMTRLGRTVLEAEDVAVELGGRRLLDRVTWRLGPGDRVGIVGVNGSGKTTLLKALTGARPLDGGRLVRGSTVQHAELSQELVELPPDQRVLEATEEVARYVRLGRQEMSASQVLERLGFPAARQWTPVGRLSGGERRRLQLTRLLMAEPNVLLLDEPTNDLDVDTLANLEDLLDGWPGTLVVVSHDRYLVERTCDTVVALLGDGRITHLPGGIEEYLERRAGAPPAVIGGSERARTVTGGGAATGPAPVPPSGRSPVEQRAARKEAARLERRLDVLTEREKELHTALAEAATDAPRLLALDAELREVVAEREAVEVDWLAAAELAE
jgi:ABC transport system ATP-binding/permease protein